MGDYFRGGKEGHNRGFYGTVEPRYMDTKGAIESVRGARIKRVEFRENVRAYVPQGQGKLSLITGDRIKRVSVNGVRA